MNVLSLEKFWDYVDITENHWYWNRPLDTCGYGTLQIKLVKAKAHRLSYTLFKGEIPDGLVIDHLCRVKGCVNPDHLEVVTSKENILRGTGRAAKNITKVKCPKGHSYSVSNTYRYIKKDGSINRICRICASTRARDYYRNFYRKVQV